MTAKHINTLPPEIIARVFLLCTIEGTKNQSPWKLAAVCRQWRLVAFDSPRIWNAIKYECGLTTHSENVNWERFQRMIVLARASPLDLDLKLYGNNNTPEKARSLMQLVGGERLRQWRHFSFFKAGEDLGDFWEGYFGHPEASLESLEGLHMNSVAPIPMLDLMDRTARRMRSLEMRNADVEMPKFFNRLWLRGIESLSLLSGRGIYASDLAKLLPSIDRLRVLTIDLSDEIDHFDHNLVLFLQSLELLTIRYSNPIAHYLLAPSLVTLKLDTGRIPPLIYHMDTIYLPSLNELHLEGVTSIVTASCLQCPRLTLLYIGQLYFGDDFIHQFARRQAFGLCRVNPTTLILQDLTTNTKTMLHFLSVMTNTTVLTMPNVTLPFHNGIWKYFHAATGSHKILCPNLEEMRIRTSENCLTRKSKRHWKPVIELLRTLTRERMRIGSPLRRLETLNEELKEIELCSELCSELASSL